MTESFSGGDCAADPALCTLDNQVCQAAGTVVTAATADATCALSVGKLLHVTNRK